MALNLVDFGCREYRAQSCNDRRARNVEGGSIRRALASQVYVDQAKTLGVDQGDAIFKREPGSPSALLEQLIKTVADRPYAHTEIPDEFGDDRHGDNVPRGEAGGMPFM